MLKEERKEGIKEAKSTNIPIFIKKILIRLRSQHPKS
jgi:hypothetical protein